MSYFSCLDAYKSDASADNYDYISGEHEDVIKNIIRASKDRTNIIFYESLSDSTVELLKDCGFVVFENIYNDSTQIYWNS